jgi:hypothetical protein
MDNILLCPIPATTMGRLRTQPPFIDGRLIMTESTQRPWSYELSMDKENWIEDMEESRENLEGLVQRITTQNDMSRLEYLTLEDNNMALSPEEKLELVALEIQKDAIMKKHQFFSSWIHTKVED